MILRIEHLGIAVKDGNAALQLFESLLGRPAYKTEAVDSEKVITHFYQVGESKVELLAAGSPDSTIAKFIEKRGEGIHHVAFEVDDIRNEMLRLKEGGFQLLSDEPQKGADNKLICFLHPRYTGGVLVELCQQIK
ncbi:MAG: methylmalonyl-CoA epimerase [Bacteroidia bacterium]|nr:methylmalonyl-CoA epimerase [Bacteroidia bacterium]